MRTKLIQLILTMVFGCFMATALTAQTLNKPEPAANPNLPGNDNDAWTAACASANFNQYFVEFTWSPPLVASDNEFILELSDASGDFSSPTELARVGDKNTDFDFLFEFNLPQDTQGDGYKFRVKSTSPAVTSDASDAFSMYFIDFDSPILISQNANGTIPAGGEISICGGGSVTLAPHNVTNPEIYNYNWYRSGTLLTEKTHSITVSDPGMYYVEINYGPICSGSANTLSNAIDIKVGNATGLAINTPSSTTLCPADSVTLEASVSGQGYSYSWYKDGNLISGPTVDAHTYTVNGSDANFAGDYMVEVSGSGICLEQSAAVSLNSPANFSVNLDTANRLVLLPGTSETLAVSTDASNPRFQWFKDGNLLAGETNATLSINATGDYYATITEGGGACGSTQETSDSITVVSPQSISLTIAYDGAYADCNQSSVALKVTQITAEEGGQSFDATAQLQNSLNYQWTKDGNNVAGNTNASIALASNAENGTYALQATLGSFNATSNNLAVVLNSIGEVTLTGDGNQVCEGNPITLSTNIDLNGKTFSWTQNGTDLNNTAATLSVSTPGSYQLNVTDAGCTVSSAAYVVSPFDDSAIVVDAEENIVFPEGESQTVTASGGTSYEWYDAQNNLVASTDSYTMQEEGEYLLIAYIDNCQVSKSFTVSFREAFQIPNVITANGDGINDMWVIPNTYSRQADVTVIIYNEVGEELLNQTDYANNWPPATQGFSQKNQLFYYKIRKENQTLKQGTITVIR